MEVMEDFKILENIYCIYISVCVNVCVTVCVSDPDCWLDSQEQTSAAPGSLGSLGSLGGNHHKAAERIYLQRADLIQMEPISFLRPDRYRPPGRPSIPQRNISSTFFLLLVLLLFFFFFFFREFRRPAL